MFLNNVYAIIFVMKYCIGIDLHGTLLDNDWEIKPEIKKELIFELKRIQKFSDVYICTGNDLTFILKHVIEDVRSLLAGYILETGCVVSDENKEKIIIPKENIAVVKKLRQVLEQEFGEKTKYFGRRLITISMFTKDEFDGENPENLFLEVKDFVENSEFKSFVHVTHSNVAVDIIPINFHKFTGLKYVAGDAKTIAIADSLNDFDLILNADFSFLPSNASPKIETELKKYNKKIESLEKFYPSSNQTIFQSSFENTLGVIDILKKITAY